MKHILIFAALLACAFSSELMASSCNWDHTFLAKFHYSPNENRPVKNVTIHAGVLKTCNYQNCGNGDWVDVKDVSLVKSTKGDFVGIQIFAAQGQAHAGYGSSEPSALMVQYWVEYQDGEVEISSPYQYKASIEFHDPHQMISTSALQELINELEETNTNSIFETSVVDFLSNLRS